MGWSVGSGWNWSYNATANVQNNAVHMLTYTNDTGSPVMINSCFLYLGTGNGTFTSTSGDTVEGSGNTYTAYAYATDSNGVQVTSDTLTINNKVSSSYSEVAKKTFTFSSGVYVANGSSVLIYIYFGMTTTWQTVVIAYNRNSESYRGGTTSPAGTVWIHNGTTWVQAIPWVHNGTEWKQCIPWVHNGTEWKQCGG